MNKLQGKDLINVGIFTAIYFVVMMAIAMLGFIPIFLPLLIVLGIGALLPVPCSVSWLILF